MPLDPLSQYDLFKQSLMQQYGMSGGNQVSGPAMSGTTQADRYQQQAGRGTAPFTAGNMLAAGTNALGLMGGMGPITAGIGSMAELAGGMQPGDLGGLQTMTGFHAIPPERRKLLRNL